MSATWQPIETAPREEDREIPVCWQGRPGWAKLSWKTNRRIVEAKKNGEFGRHLASYFGDPNEDDDYDLALPENQPTHWFSLPKMPGAEIGRAHSDESVSADTD